MKHRPKIIYKNHAKGKRSTLSLGLCTEIKIRKKNLQEIYHLSQLSIIDMY